MQLIPYPGEVAGHRGRDAGLDRRRRCVRQLVGFPSDRRAGEV